MFWDLNIENNSIIFAFVLLLQSILSNISSEITTLQKKSVSMSVQLTNRQGVRAQLSQFIEYMAIPEEMIKWAYFL